MSQYETLLLEKQGRVAIVTINRPDKRNALNIKTREEGAAILEELRNDDSIGVVVFTGAGDKAFVAGADIAEFAGRTSITQRDVMMGRSLFTAVDRLCTAPCEAVDILFRRCPRRGPTYGRPPLSGPRRRSFT